MALPSTTILELSQRDADVVHTNANGQPRNGDYTSNFAETITLNEGDQLNLRMASIDSQRATTESIVIPPQGQILSMQYSYYDNNYEIPTPNTASGVPPKDPAQQKVQFGTRGSGDTPYEPTFTAHVAYIEPGALRLESFTLTGGGSKPYNVPGDTVLPVCAITVPLFSWSDATTGELRTNTGSLSIGDSNVGSNNAPNISRKGSKGSYGDGGQKLLDNYEYIGCTVPADPLAEKYSDLVSAVVCKPLGQLNATQKNAINRCSGFPPHSASFFIDFKEGSLRLIGVIGIIMASREISSGGIRPVTDSGVGLYSQSGLSNWRETSQSTQVIATVGAKQLVTRTAGIRIEGGRYDRTTLAQIITEELTEVGLTTALQPGGSSVFGANTDLQLRMDDAKNELLLFTQIPDNTGDTLVFDANTSYQYPTSATTTIGARIFALEYGTVGDAYQISNMHQSLNSGLTAEKAQEQAAIFSTNTASKAEYHQLLASTGIVIHDLFPKDFWANTLGLYDRLVVPLRLDTNGVEFFTAADIADKITTETAQIQSFSQANQRGTPAPQAASPGDIVATYFNTTDNPTKSIIGDTPSISESSGTYYIIEITGLNVPQSNLISNNQNYANISAIVSKQYDSDDIVTGFADSAIPYVHRGLPVKLSSARVRILDPISKEVVTTLGDQNSVFLQVNSVIEPAALTQTQIQGKVN
tara:strand:- start:417 stop:2513 length:2097 start_codon:yes stop_codon:yes gene_type:complete